MHFFFQAEDGIRDGHVTGVQTCALPISGGREDDILFEGNRVMWARFGNTIKLRALIRQSETGNDSYIQTEIDKIMAEGSGFLSKGETVTANPGDSYSRPHNLDTNVHRHHGGSSTHVHHSIRPTEYLTA